MKKITVYEVGPRDGFQNQKHYIEQETKLAIIDSLVRSGVDHLQVTSFMSPKAVPQMRDAAAVAQACCERYPALTLSALVPNLQGASNAWAAGIRRIFYVVSLSESHNLKNINRTHAQSMLEFQSIRQTYPELEITLDLATTFGCPFEGRFPVEEILEFLQGYVHAGIDAVDPVFSSSDHFEEGKVYQVKIRSTAPGADAYVHSTPDGFSVDFISYVKGAAPGQSAVVYDGERVIASGFISSRRSMAKQDI